MNKILIGLATLALSTSITQAETIQFSANPIAGGNLYDLDPYIGQSNFSLGKGITFDGPALVYAASDQVAGTRLAPGATSAYIAVQPNQPEVVNYSTPQTSIYFKVYTLDNYNNFNFGSVTFNGDQIASLSGIADNGTNTVYGKISGLNPFTTATFYSTGVAQEMNVGSAVPEISTWAMMGIGFLGLLYAANCRKNESRLTSI